MKLHWQSVYDQVLEDLNQFFRQMPSESPNARTIYTHGAVTRIQREMERLGQKYKFSSGYLKPEYMEEDTINIRSIKRAIKMRFRCFNYKCSAFIKRQNKAERSSDLYKSWTSFNGVVEFRFFFKFLFSNSSQRPHLTYSFLLYKQKCTACMQWAKPGLIESYLEELINLYSLIVQNSMVLKNSPQRIQWSLRQKQGKILYEEADQKKKDQIYRSHKEELCQACQFGICMRAQRKEAKEEEKSSQMRPGSKKETNVSVSNKNTKKDDEQWRSDRQLR